MQTPIQLNFSWGQSLTIDRKGMRIQLICKQSDYEVLIDMTEHEAIDLTEAITTKLRENPHGDTSGNTT